MANQTGSGDIKKLLQVISIHQKGQGGGTPANSPSAQLKNPPTKQNSFMQWLTNAVNNANQNFVAPVAQGVGDAGNFVKEDAQAWANLPQQLAQYLQGKKMTPNANLSSSAQRGGDILSGILMGNPAPEMGAVEGNAGYIANQAKGGVQNVASGVKQGVVDSLQNGAMQPGGLQAGFIKPLATVGGNGTKVVRDMRYVQGTDNPNAYKAVTKPATETPQYANNNQATTSLPSQTPPAPPASTLPASAAKDTARARTYAIADDVAQGGNVAENTKRNLQYTSDGISTPKQKAQINATLNGYGIKGSFDSQLQGIEDHKAILSNAAAQQVAEDGGTTGKADLLKNMTQSVAYNGSKHTIPSSQIANATSKYLNNVYVRATGGDPTKLFGDVMPKDIPDTVVQKMKSIMGQDASNTFTKDPTSWTTSEQLARYGRNSFDTILDAKHPAASTLNNDTADLYDAQESIMKGANKESNDMASQPPPKTGMDRLNDILAVASRHPYKTAATLGSLGLIGYGAHEALANPNDSTENPINSSGNGKNEEANASQEQNPANSINNTTNHGQSISNSTTNVNSIPDLATIKDSSGNPLTLGFGNYSNSIKQINDQEGALQSQLQSYDPTVVRNATAQYHQLENKRDTLDTQYKTSQDVIAAHTDSVNQYSALQDARSLIHSAKPEWLQAVSQKGVSPFTSLRLSFDPAFTTWHQYLNTAAAKSGLDVSLALNAASPAVADAAIGAQQKRIADNFKQKVVDSGGVYSSNTQQKPATGKDVVQHQANQVIQTGSPMLDSILTPTPTQEASPTPDRFQQLLQATIAPYRSVSQ